MLDTPFPPWPSCSEDEVAAVAQVLRSNRVNYWTGSECRAFEQEFAEWASVSHAVAVANGTVALDLALNALGVKQGDEVIVTCRSFIASASCIVNAGATPVFADVDPDSQNITAESIAPLITNKTAGFVCVHLAGWPCDMDPIMDLAKQHGFFVIEDCAQAHGATYKGRPVGSIGTVAAWSFCQDKIMTTGGEGGMVTTNNHDLWRRMWAYKDHGKSWEAVYERKHAPGFRWLHESIGTNWRMLEIQAAIGRIQLKKMPSWHRMRLENARAIWRAARSIKGLRVPLVPDAVEHAAYKCYVFVEPDSLREDWSRDRILSEIVLRGVPCYTGSCSEIYLEKAFSDLGYQPPSRHKVAQQLGETSLMFLVHPTLSSQDIAKTCNVLGEVMGLAVK